MINKKRIARELRSMANALDKKADEDPIITITENNLKALKALLDEVAEDLEYSLDENVSWSDAQDIAKKLMSSGGKDVQFSTQIKKIDENLRALYKQISVLAENIV